MVDKTWYAENDMQKGYKWSVQAEHGVVTISEEELFDRIEFQELTAHAEKASYAMRLGWRFNVDNSKWYRIKGY